MFVISHSYHYMWTALYDKKDNKTVNNAGIALV